MKWTRAISVAGTIVMTTLAAGCANRAEGPTPARTAAVATAVTDSQPGDLVGDRFVITGRVIRDGAPVSGGTLVAALKTTDAHCGSAQVGADGSFEMTVTAARVSGGGPQCENRATLIFLYHQGPGVEWRRARDEVAIDYGGGKTSVEVTVFVDSTPMP